MERNSFLPAWLDLLSDAALLRLSGPAVFARGQGGLLDVAVDPKFAQNRTIFFTFAEPGDSGTAGTAVGRGRLVGNALTEVDDSIRQEIIGSLPNEQIAQAVQELDSDDATTILEDLEDDRRERILEDLAPVDRAELERSLGYEEETAGRLMQTEFVAVPEFWTVGQTIDHARDRGTELPEVFYDVYVIDPAHRLLGIVSLSDLLRQPRETPCRHGSGSPG